MYCRPVINLCCHYQFLSLQLWWLPLTTIYPCENTAVSRTDTATINHLTLIIITGTELLSLLCCTPYNVTLIVLLFIYSHRLDILSISNRRHQKISRIKKCVNNETIHRFCSLKEKHCHPLVCMVVSYLVYTNCILYSTHQLLTKILLKSRNCFEEYRVMNGYISASLSIQLRW